MLRVPTGYSGPWEANIYSPRDQPRAMARKVQPGAGVDRYHALKLFK